MSPACARAAWRAAQGFCSTRASIPARPSAIAALRHATVAARTCAGPASLPSSASMARSTAPMSKRSSCGPAGGSADRAAARLSRGLESEAAEASWGGVNHDHLLVLDLSDREAALVGAIRKEPEDAADPGEARALRKGGGRQRVRCIRGEEGTDRRDGVVGEIGVWVGRAAVTAGVSRRKLADESRVGYCEPGVLKAREGQRRGRDVEALEPDELHFGGVDPVFRQKVGEERKRPGGAGGQEQRLGSREAGVVRNFGNGVDDAFLRE